MSESVYAIPYPYQKKKKRKQRDSFIEAKLSQLDEPSKIFLRDNFIRSKDIHGKRILVPKYELHSRAYIITKLDLAKSPGKVLLKIGNVDYENYIYYDDEFSGTVWLQKVV